jgi:hypothetical protein
VLVVGIAACARRAEREEDAATSRAPDVGEPLVEDASPESDVRKAAAVDAPPPRVDGPHEIPLAPGRTVYYALPGAPGTSRVIGHIHGVCGPPFYACGKWLDAAGEVGVLVCPTGNARCGDPATGLATWEAPSWGELVATMDRDLEKSVAKVAAKHQGSFTRDGAILTGYSRGGFAVPLIASMHPGRWPLLVIIEADAALSAAAMKRAGVRAISLVSGEYSPERKGMTKSAEALTRAGVPTRLFVMPKTGHLYSANMDDVMRDALAFVVGAAP